MAKKFTYTRSVNLFAEGTESFSAVEFDSFDEAIRAVEKGIYDVRTSRENLKISLKPPVGGGTGNSPVVPMVPKEEKKTTEEEKAPETTNPIPKK